MRVALAIAILIICVIDVQAQTSQDYCVRTKQWDKSDVKKVDPFKDLRTIRLVSFDGVVNGGDFAGIPKDKEGKIDMKRMEEVVDVDCEIEKRLIETLFNYDYDPKFNGVIETTRNLCYIPRNAILFIDGKDEIIGYVEICFECQREEIRVKSNSIGGFCFDKFAILKAIFKDAGIKYGVVQK